MEKPKLIVFSQEERERVAPGRSPEPTKRIDPSKLKVKKQEKTQQRSLSGGLGRFTKPGRTARDHAKPQTGIKTNTPEICQKMKGQKGSKPTGGMR